MHVLRRFIAMLGVVVGFGFGLAIVPAEAHDPHLVWVQNSLYDDALSYQASSIVTFYTHAVCHDGPGNLTYVASQDGTYLHGITRRFKMTGVPPSKCCLTMHNAWSGERFAGPICFYDG